MISAFTAWLVALLTQWWTDFWTFVGDAVIAVFDAFSQALVAVVGAIAVPSFISGGLGTLFSGVDPGIRFMVSQTGIIPGLALIGAGFGFRMLRKIVTLFQW